MPDSKPKAKTPKKAPVATPNTAMSQAEKKTNQRFIIWMGVLIGAIVILGGYGVYRLGTTYVHEANKIKAQDMLITSLDQKEKNLQALKPNYEAITAKGANGVSDADLIMHALPLDSDYQGLIAMLEKMAQESGVKVTSVTQGSGAAGSSTTAAPGAAAASGSSNSSSAQPFTFTVGLEGSYQGILDFLTKTQQASRVMNFSSMTLSGGSSGTVQANVTMQTYFQGPANIQSTTRPL